MKLCIVVEIDDNSAYDEMDFAVREAARVAGFSFYSQGCLEIDEDRSLEVEAACVQSASIFRPE